MRAYYIKTLALMFMMLFSACGNGGSVDDEHYKKKMAVNLQQASLWLIEDGVKVFSEKGKDGLHRKLVDDWGVLLWIDPWVETEDYLAQFRIKARGINYQILNMHRESVDNNLYEMWVVKIVAKQWSGEKNRSMFYVTETNDKFGSRKIVKKSDQFIDAYSVGGKKVSIPTDDLNVLYELEAWEFPDNYRDSNLKNKKVVMDSSGNIEYEH